AAEAGAIPRDGRGHAQPTVRIGVVAAKMPLEELADQVDGFGVELTASIKGDGVGAVGVENVGEDFAGVAKCGVPVDGAEIVTAAETKLGMRQTVVGVNGGTELGALGTDAAEVRESGLDPADALDLAHFAFECQPAAHAAVRTNVLAQ